MKSRGLIVENEDAALKILECTNYYRLRGYYIHLQKENSDDFKDGVTFEQIVALHDFDNELRSLLLRILLDIEVVTRTRMAYALAHAWGPMGYRNEENYNGADHDKFDFLMARIDGDLSKLYNLLPTTQKKKIADAYDELDKTLLTNWIQCCVVLRNLCAHNSRIYAQNIPIPIKIERKMQSRIAVATNGAFKARPQTLFSYLLAIRRISNAKAWNSFCSDLVSLLEKYSNVVELVCLGMPDQWEQFINKK